MYIKVDLFFIFYLVKTNLSYNIDCWYYINDRAIVITHLVFLGGGMWARGKGI
jgi:hypothetical protein